MRLSRYFLPLLKEVPKEAEVVSHVLMLRAGMIRQQASGLYCWLPLGYKVLQKVQKIIEQEQNRAGAIQMLMPTIQSADLWRESGRYDAYGKEMLRITDRHDRDLLFGPTNEEVITDILRSSVRSYKQLPLNLYHIQWKFRDEIRPRFGTMRSREFLMKDAYSFDVSREEARKSYQKMFVSYLRTYHRMGLNAVPMKAETGPIGGDLSHEFIVLADTGESGVFCHQDLLTKPIPAIDIDYDSDLSGIVNEWTSLYAATEDMIDMEEFKRRVPEDKRIAARGIEVGQVFYFGTKYSDKLNASVTGPDGKQVPVHSGSYGIGLTRIVPALIEVFHDEAGIVWPLSVAPFEVIILNLKTGDPLCSDICENLYGQMNRAGLDVLYDDSGEGAGAKFAAADLIGIPFQLIIGPRGAKSGEAEIKNRKTGERQTVPVDRAVATLISLIEPERRDKI